jgi:hypothetical protein
MLADQPPRGFIHPQREYAEYLTFLYAILDDTDLLSKVTARDVLCVASLLNRLKTLITGREQEIINFDDLIRDTSFAKKAAKRILQQADMYSIYRKLYSHREKDVEEQIIQCGQGELSDFFSDTKIQNGCCSVGQTKLFVATWPTFQEYKDAIRQRWLDRAATLVVSHSELDLHLHMISTITSAEDVYTNRGDYYEHSDELWLWGPATRQAYAHLGSFLLAFQNAPEMQHNELSLTICAQPDESLEIEEIFRRQFIPTPITIQPSLHSPWAILYFRAGSVNSRKAMITPYLPRPIA